MKRKRHIVIFLITALLLVTATGCGSDKELWEILEEQQYNRYKPKLDYMVKKYGDMFVMDVYGTVTCTNQEYKDWHLKCNAGSDNFAIRLRRDDLELFMREIAEPIFGPCKVYVNDGYPCTLDADADIEDFFTYNDKWGVVEYCIYVPYSEDYQAQGEALMDTLERRHYTLSNLDILFVEEEAYEQAGRGLGTFGELPEGYRFRLHSGFYDEWNYKWIENTGLAHMAEKYGDMFEMDLKGNITCTDPEYQDWSIIIDHNTEAQYPDMDNFAIRLRRDDLELFMKELAEPIFGECKVYVTDGFASTLGADADIEDFFHYKNVISGLYNRLVFFRIYVPYSDDYYEQAEQLTLAIVNNQYRLYRITIQYFDEERYEQLNRLSEETIVVSGGVHYAMADGYRVTLQRFFREEDYYTWKDRNLSWTELR